MVRFLDGGATIEYLDTISLPDFMEIHVIAKKISDREEQYIKKGK